MAQSNESQVTSQQSSQMSQANTTPISTGAAEQPTQRKLTGKIGRRALLATAGVGVCAAGVAVTPLVVKDLTQLASNEAHQALTDGIAQGEQAVINELGQIEGVALDDAIAVAELTRKAVQFIVLPISRLLATITGDGLAVLDGALGKIQQGQDIIHFNVIPQIGGLRHMVESWRNDVNQLPITLTAFANADIISAENYLKALRKKVQQNGGSTH